MRVFRRPPSKRWWVDVWPLARRLRLPAYTDKAASEKLGRQIERLGAHVGSGDTLPVDLVRWLERLPAPMHHRLAQHGLISDARMTALRPLREHVAEWEGWIRARASAKHARQSGTLARRVLDDLRWRYWTQLDAVRLQTYLHEITLPPRSIAARTSNSYLGAIRQFTRWMATEGRAVADPLMSVRKINEARAGKKKIRRPLTEDEIGRLLEAAAAGPKHGRLTGAERVVVYRVAMECGLRANEIRRLEARDIELDGNVPVLVVRAIHKAGREDRIPMRADLLEVLRPQLALLTPRSRVFPRFPHESKQAPMLYRDLLAAGIPPKNAAGEDVDFHALRHTATSRWHRAGVSPKTLQRLARHTDVRLTMNVYTHTSLSEDARAIESVPPLPLSSSTSKEAAAATGTDCASQRATGLSSHGAGTSPSGLRPSRPVDEASRTLTDTSEEDEHPMVTRRWLDRMEAAPGFEPGMTDLQSADETALGDDPPSSYGSAVEALCLSLCLSPGEEKRLRSLIDQFRAELGREGGAR